ncbi:MAG: SufD family Fe-S cluster assembly protein [Lacticaseibacillus songhuajiangensis]|jgi:Fe-S cluster assembly protein SufD|nr:SufD family Fe-S cluster assembly protein [Lacticaseibacillus songhuajiangensis]
MGETKDETQQWPQLPKASWARLLRPSESATTVSPHFDLPAGVQLAKAATLPTASDKLDAALRQQPTQLTLTIPADWHGERPVTIDADAQSSCVLVINVGAGAHVHLRETWHGRNEAQLHLLVRLKIGFGAVVRYDTLDLLTGDVAIYRHAKLAEQAQLDWHAATLGECSGGVQHTVDLNGRSSRTNVRMAALAGGNANLYVTTTVNNRGRATQGLINQHGVLTAAAKMVLTGIGAIMLGARGSDAQQENRVLMLSDKAVGEANPLLLIDENDVTAGHAASVAAVDAQQLYYLMSRGLERTVALRLVVRGFLLSLLPDDLPAQQLAAVQNVIEAQLIAGDKA